MRLSLDRLLPLIVLATVLGLLAAVISTLIVDDSAGSLGICPPPTGTTRPVLERTSDQGGCP
jgi:hypothetical protein